MGTDLIKSKAGKIVSKKASAAGKRAYKHISGWTKAVQKARKQLKVKGFVAVKKGSALQACKGLLWQVRRQRQAEARQDQVVRAPECGVFCALSRTANSCVCQ